MWGAQYPILEAFVHPAWHGGRDSGFDIGIGILGAYMGNRSNALSDHEDMNFFLPQVMRVSD